MEVPALAKRQPSGRYDIASFLKRPAGERVAP
jgi:hypothetical protein